MKYALILLTLLTFFSCARGPYYATNKQYKKEAKAFGNLLSKYPLQDSVATSTEFIGTTNFSMRRPNFVIIHHTAQNSCDQTLKTFTTRAREVSAHYVICKDGTVHHMLNDLLRAHHAGIAKWGNNTDINSSSIGIEIDNNGFEAFTPEQINSLTALLDRLKRAYNIPIANFIGHADIAPGRKVDPNRNFPWQDLSQRGFGLWYDTASIQLVPEFDPIQALRVIGYNVQKPEAAIASFKLHFIPADSLPGITDGEKKILASLEKQSQ